MQHDGLDGRCAALCYAADFLSLHGVEGLTDHRTLTKHSDRMPRSCSKQAIVQP
jgi:hypothetical protein